MLSEKEFKLLCALDASLSQRELAARTGLSLGAVNNALTNLKGAGLVSEDGISELGIKALEPYRVDNAVILAAGMATRFMPLSIEKPKGLLKVHGEVLIERQIRQLQEAGITDITIVVGYLKEQFFYLEEKFGVKIVVNDDYYRYNNTSSLMLVKDILSNTYICCSDNWFDKNVFEKYVYNSYYSAVYSADYVNEYCLDINSKGFIRNVVIGGENAWYMFGHVFFSRSFSKKFATILEEEYRLPKTHEELWEDVFIRHRKELNLSVRKYPEGVIYEFDSLDDLRLFDSSYVNNIDSQIIINICSQLDCNPADVRQIIPIKSGMTNISFRFTVKGQDYVYRYPGRGTEAYISRKGEAEAISAASRLGIDNTYIHMDADTGWKLSRYIEGARELDYHNDNDVRMAVEKLKILHDANIKVENDFDVWNVALGFVSHIQEKGRDDYVGFNALLEDMRELESFTRIGDIRRCLCHCDCFSTNFMVHEGGIELIDWEYAGNDDPALDLGVFICSCEDYTFEDAVRILELYYGRVLTDKELRHGIAYIALASYYCFTWALYQELRGQFTGKYLYLWQKSAKKYSKKALDMYRSQN